MSVTQGINATELVRAIEQAVLTGLRPHAGLRYFGHDKKVDAKLVPCSVASG